MNQLFRTIFSRVHTVFFNTFLLPALLQCSESQWDKIFDTNVKGPFLLTQLAAPEMERRPGGGAVVIVASLAGLNPFPFLGPYSVSKTALLGLTKALAAELAPRNIRVNCIAPGVIETKFASAVSPMLMK